MIQIDVDQEVFEFLQKNAKPLVDTPNTVLRRLLLIDQKTPLKTSERKTAMLSLGSNKGHQDSSEFVHVVLEKEFANEFQRKPPYRFMFESDNELIYFQNFNQESATLWYRITERPLKILRTSNKKCFICLTNPAENIAYLIPFQEIEKHLASSNWDREHLEINIDHVSYRWRELDWSIKQFLRKY